MCQQNQRYGCSEDLLESYGMPKLPIFLQKSQFSSGMVVSQKKNSYWIVGSLLYANCGWCFSQKHKIECLSSIICDFIGCWKLDKLQKVEKCELKTRFWSPISSEQCLEIHIYYINLKIWAESARNLKMK